MTARRAPENDLTGDAEEARALAPSFAEWGVCGWEGDATDDDVVAGIGDGSASADGRTLVHVTLFAGRDLSRRPEPGKAQGRKILCQLGWPLTVVPPLGMQVAVLFPGGEEQTPGNGLILCGAAPAPTAQYAASRGVLDLGAKKSLTVKAKYVVLKDQADAGGGFGAWVGVGPIAGGAAGVYAQDGYGGGFQATGGDFHAMASDGTTTKAQIVLSPTVAQMTLAGTGVVSLDSNGATLHSETAVNFLGLTFGFGDAPTLPVLAGLTGLAGVPSVNILVSVA